MNLGLPEHDHGIVRLAGYWEHLDPRDHDDAPLPFYYDLPSDPPDWRKPRHPPFGTPVHRLTTGQVFGTIKRLARQVQVLEADLEVERAWSSVEHWLRELTLAQDDPCRLEDMRTNLRNAKDRFEHARAQRDQLNH